MLGKKYARSCCKKHVFLVDSAFNRFVPTRRVFPVQKSTCLKHPTDEFLTPLFLCANKILSTLLMNKTKIKKFQKKFLSCTADVRRCIVENPEQGNAANSNEEERK